MTKIMMQQTYKDVMVFEVAGRPSLRGIEWGLLTCPQRRRQQGNWLCHSLLLSLCVYVLMSWLGSLLSPYGCDLSRESGNLTLALSDKGCITSGLKYSFPHMILFLAASAALNT